MPAIGCGPRLVFHSTVLGGCRRTLSAALAVFLPAPPSIRTRLAPRAAAASRRQGRRPYRRLGRNRARRPSRWRRVAPPPSTGSLTSGLSKRYFMSARSALRSPRACFLAHASCRSRKLGLAPFFASIRSVPTESDGAIVRLSTSEPTCPRRTPVLCCSRSSRGSAGPRRADPLGVRVDLRLLILHHLLPMHRSLRYQPVLHIDLSVGPRPGLRRLHRQPLAPLVDLRRVDALGQFGGRRRWTRRAW